MKTELTQKIQLGEELRIDIVAAGSGRWKQIFPGDLGRNKQLPYGL